MKHLLLVPIQTDAIFLSEDTLVTEATADFSRLPYFNGSRDVNADVANIAENIVSKPLQDQNLRLRKGLHLHWALPDALNRGRHREDGRTDFPTVPNRWLVTRRWKGTEKSWVVESDYLFPEEKELLLLDKEHPMRLARRECITVPIDTGARESGRQPFRYMGRKVNAADYKPVESAERYPNLTTVGYGEPSFAAFYPNCRSVFGFHDPEIEKDSGSVNYDIIGWYSDAKDDFFKKLTAGVAPEDLEQHLRERAGWVLESMDTMAPDDLPQQTLLCSRIEVNTAGADDALPQNKAAKLSVVIGNTGTEALSAYLAQRLASLWPETAGKEKALEEQLEALYLLDKLDHRVLDLNAKFDEARHENGFNAVEGGHSWTITLESAGDQPADAVKEAGKPQMPPEIARAINSLNRLQQAYDHANAALESLGTQLFTDWYKYMMSAYPPEDSRTDYPDIDEVRHFIETKIMAPLKKKDAETGRLILATAEEIARGRTPAAGTGNGANTTAKLLARDINQLFFSLNNLNATLPEGSALFALKRTGGPRYWVPTEPVILLANDEANNPIVRPTDRHGRDGRLRSDGLLEVLAAENGDAAYLSTPVQLHALHTAIQPLIAPGSVGYAQWAGQPWNPFRLDWEVELAPLQEGTNLFDKDYEPDFLTKPYSTQDGPRPHFSLPVNAPDLEADLLSKADYKGRNPNIYTGHSLLTPHVKRNLDERLTAYLQDNLPGQSLDQFLNDDSLAKQKAQELGGAVNPVATALMAYVALNKPNLHLLSQAFSGFNYALLQLQQTFQMPIADPIGFNDYLPFTAEVARLAEHSTLLAPQPLTDFNPIRTGQMVVNQLRLVDTFGQKRDIDLGKLDRVLGAGPTPTALSDSKIEAPLQPRLAQPARLHFRWLNAIEGTQEMNAHPNTSPVCGWILTNQLDDSLVIYDAEGHMLGAIEAEPDPAIPALARWNSAPGALHPIRPENIENPFLQKMVAQVRSGGPGFVAQFLDGLDSVLRTIEPETFESQQALSLLIGRPIALVRASLHLELLGMPAADQGWNAFYRDRRDGDHDRNRDGFTKVKFPVRIGACNQFNDGLVGYWKEENGALSGEFLINQLPLDNITDTAIKFLNDTEIPVFQSIDDAPQLVSMLIDPRGKVHAATGILPVKDISIPPDQYLPAMQRIGVTFLTAPLLSPERHIYSLLPTVEDFQWSWIERIGENWREVFPYPHIEKGTFLQAFSDRIMIQLQQKGWIAPFHQDTFLLQPEDTHQLPDGQFELVEGELLGMLDEIAQKQTLEDGSVEEFFSRAQFQQKLFAPHGIGNRVWEALLSSAVAWLKPVPEPADTGAVAPAGGRVSQDLPNLGMEFLIEEILEAHAQILQEPSTAAGFAKERITIREGYLKLTAS